MKIPVYAPSLTGNEKKYVNDCLDSGWVSSRGSYIAKFENAFANYLDGNQSLASSVCNGTVALHLALLALDIKNADEIIVPTLTYVASVNAIKYVGATPVFVDSTADTWQIDVNAIEAKITPKTRAIMAVHLYGHPCEMEQLKCIAKKHDLYLIEDCAEALGSRFKNSHVGTFGDIATFSFFGNKTITCGEGGIIVTTNPSLHEKIVHLKNQGVSKTREYWHDVIGYNYRMTNICAAIGLAQLEQIDGFLEKKRQLAEAYQKGLNHLPIEMQLETKPAYHSYWMFSVLAKNTAEKQALRQHLANAGIETRPLFYPIHTLPMYNKGESFPIAENLAGRGINLPSWPGLKPEQINYIIKTMDAFYASTGLKSPQASERIYSA